jgi:hypothetical protein
LRPTRFGDDARAAATIEPVSFFSYVDLEERVRRGHPLRAIRMIVNEALSALEREFAALYPPIGRPSIAPEKLLRAMLLQAFGPIRAERLPGIVGQRCPTRRGRGAKLPLHRLSDLKSER